MQADVKGDIYEGLLAKSAEESPRGRGPILHARGSSSRPSWTACSPTAGDTVCDPACGTGGFLLAAYDYVVKHHGQTSTRTRSGTCGRSSSQGWELVPTRPGCAS